MSIDSFFAHFSDHGEGRILCRGEASRLQDHPYTTRLEGLLPPCFGPCRSHVSDGRKRLSGVRRRYCLRCWNSPHRFLHRCDCPHCSWSTHVSLPLACCTRLFHISIMHRKYRQIGHKHTFGEVHLGSNHHTKCKRGSFGLQNYGPQCACRLTHAWSEHGQA
jgi:hypothetical protein